MLKSMLLVFLKSDTIDSLSLGILQAVYPKYPPPESLIFNWLEDGEIPRLSVKSRSW